MVVVWSQAFQGGGRVRRVQMGRGAAKRRMEASKITPIKKKKVTVAYAEEKENMADKPKYRKIRDKRSLVLMLLP